MPPSAPPTIVESLAAWAKASGAIRRSKIPAEKKVLAAALCASGHTYRDASKILGGISHVAVHDAHKSFMAALPPPVKKRRVVAIEENETRFGEQPGVIWLARDAETGEVLSFRCSLSRSQDDEKRFIDSVLALCTERPLLRVGRGPSFPHSLRSLDLYFQIDTTPTIRQRISNFFLGGS